MTMTHKLLYDKIAELPHEKIGQALSFVRYLGQEPSEELYLDPVEEEELHELLASDDFVDSSVVFAKIMEMQDDKVS